jgi:hypothetical protein
MQPCFIRAKAPAMHKIPFAFDEVKKREGC